MTLPIPEGRSFTALFGKAASDIPKLKAAKLDRKAKALIEVI